MVGLLYWANGSALIWSWEEKQPTFCKLIFIGKHITPALRHALATLYDVVLAQSSQSLLAAAGIASLLPAPVRVYFADLLFRLIGFHRVHGCFLLHDHDALYCGEALGTDWRRIGMQPIGQRHFRITAGCKTYPGRKTQQTSIPRQSPSAGHQASNE